MYFISPAGSDLRVVTRKNCESGRSCAQSARSLNLTISAGAGVKAPHRNHCDFSYGRHRLPSNERVDQNSTPVIEPWTCVPEALGRGCRGPVTLVHSNQVLDAPLRMVLYRTPKLGPVSRAAHLVSVSAVHISRDRGTGQYSRNQASQEHKHKFECRHPTPGTFSIFRKQLMGGANLEAQFPALTESATLCIVRTPASYCHRLFNTSMPSEHARALMTARCLQGLSPEGVAIPRFNASDNPAASEEQSPHVGGTV